MKALADLLIICTIYESTTGADASVEMPKLHNIKLLIAFIHVFVCCMQTQRVGNDRP